MAHPGVQLTELLDGALASASDRRLVRRVRSLLDAFKSASGAYPRRWRTRGGFEENGCDLVARCAVRAPLAGVLGLLVDALGVDPNAATPGGLSLLHLAAAYDNADAVVALLGRGAVHAEDARGRTPLDLARAYAFTDARARILFRGVSSLRKRKPLKTRRRRPKPGSVFGPPCSFFTFSI